MNTKTTIADISVSLQELAQLMHKRADFYAEAERAILEAASMLPTTYRQQPPASYVRFCNGLFPEWIEFEEEYTRLAVRIWEEMNDFGVGYSR